MKLNSSLPLLGLLLLALASRHASAFAPTIPTAGLDPNQHATAAALNRSIPPEAEFDPPLVAGVVDLPASQQPQALNQLSPEEFQNFTRVLAFNNASFEVMAMDSYLATLRNAPNGNFAGGGKIDVSGLSVNDPNYDPALSATHSRMLAWNPSPSDGTISDVTDAMMGGMDSKDMKDTKAMAEPAYGNPWHFFVRGNVVLSQGFSQQDVSHFDANTSGVVLGTDYRISPHLLVGITASFAHTDATLNTNGSSATVDSYAPGLYAAYADQGFYANVVGQYLHNAYTQDRVISFLGQTASSAPQGNEGIADLDGGYDFHFGRLVAGPLAGVQYTHLSVNGYDEGGSLADLSVGSQDSDSLRGRVGLHVSYPFQICGHAISPFLLAAYQHEFFDQSRGITSAFNAGGGDFTVRTPDPSRDSALISTGVDAQVSHNTGIFIDYLAQPGQSNYFGQSVQAGAKIAF